MSWAPGQPVVTATDHAQWESWRTERKRQQQRDRRAKNPRIDYYPSSDALAVISRFWGQTAWHPSDVSSVLDRIVAEWVECAAPE